jgi:peptide methionine sulfoxide reductase msrA/msrB
MKAVFAAGCFWGVQYYFDQVTGVTKTTVGYTGGQTDNPTYEDVCYKDTGHAEAVLIEFDETEVAYETLVRQFFRMHDPTQLNAKGQMSAANTGRRFSILMTTRRQSQSG